MINWKKINQIWCKTHEEVEWTGKKLKNFQKRLDKETGNFLEKWIKCRIIRNCSEKRGVCVNLVNDSGKKDKMWNSGIIFPRIKIWSQIYFLNFFIFLNITFSMEMTFWLWSMISDWPLHLMTFLFANLTFVQVWASPSPRNSTPVATNSYPPICLCQTGDPAESASVYWTRKSSSSPTQILPLFSKCSERPALFSLLLRPEPDGGGRFSPTSARN